MPTDNPSRGGKWALYMSELPMMKTSNTDKQEEWKVCTVVHRSEFINPLGLLTGVNVDEPVGQNVEVEGKSANDELVNRKKV